MSIVGILTATVGAGQRQATTQPAGSAPGSRVHKVEELTWRQIDALNRQRTLFILPVGMLEQHGPHLPVGADTIGIMYEANRVSTRVSQALPDWHVVMMPAVNYGHGGANLLGDRPIHPGTYAIRQSTLRSLVADIGARIAENGFKWIFVMNGHGAPTHNIALNEASDFVSETYSVTIRVGTSPDVFTPQPGVIANEPPHQVDARRILKHVEGDAARAQQNLLADKRLVLPGDDLRDAVEQDGAAAHGTR